MAYRFRRSTGEDTTVMDGGGTATAVRERDPVAERPVVDRPAPTAAVVRERTRAEYGGISWGTTLLAYLSAFGLAALLVALLAAAGAAIGLTDVKNAAQNNGAELTLGGAIGVLVALCLAYFVGGYVAGRMARFDGPRQGVGVWLWGIIVAVALGVLGYALGDQYNVLSKLNLPRLPIGSETLSTGGVITLVAVLAGTLLAAMAGGLAGERFHRRVDRYAWEDAARG